MPGLEELGWLQFERLCELVLEADAGVDPTRWEGSADQSREVVCEDELRLDGRTLAPPVLIRCQWCTRRSGRFAAFPWFKSVVTFTNRPAPGDMVYGEEELRDAIRRLPALRMKLPSILSLDAAPPDPDALARSTFDIEATRELARVFVPTPAWSRAVAVLNAHNFLVLTGPPEMGKTAIARMLGLALLTQGWEVHETTRPEQVEERFDRSQAAAVHRRRRVRLDRVPPGLRRALGQQPRPDPARDRRAPLARLDLAARAAARRPAAPAPRARRRALPAARGRPGRRLRARRGGEDADPVPPRARGRTCTPEQRDAGAPARRRRSSATRTSRPSASAASSRAASPSTTSSASCASRRRRWRPPTPRSSASTASCCCAMLDSPPGPVAERDLAAALRRHADERLPEGARRPRRPARRPLPAGDRMRVDWVHPSWRDLVIESLAARRRRAARASCALRRRRRGGRALQRGRERRASASARCCRATPTGTRSATACITCCADLDEAEAIRLLHVLADAGDDAEARALAALVLKRLGWSGKAVSVDAIGAWAAVVGERSIRARSRPRWR